MRFNLTINLDNAEALELGPNAAAVRYLRYASDPIQRGHTAGPILDGNGNTIGQYAIEDEPGDWACRECAEPWQLPSRPPAGARCGDCGGEFAHQSDR